jgi:hypothetical protein
MADSFLELTRVDVEANGTSVLVNLGQVAWIEAAEGGLTCVAFAGGQPPGESPIGAPLTIVVRESVAEIAVLAGVGQKTDREAIAQAWADQRGRRDITDEGA